MGIHSKTPTLAVNDPRGLAILAVNYWRADASLASESRIERTLRDAAGRAVKQWDARLWALQEQDPLTPSSLALVYSLNDSVVRSKSADAGNQIQLQGFAGELLFNWDSRGTCREIEYDDVLRPIAVFEEGTGVPRRSAERFAYGRPGECDPLRNQFGQLIRHDDPAGSVLFEQFAITGHCKENTRHFTLKPVAPDWPQALVDRQKLLEPGAGATTQWRYAPLGAVLEQVDACGHRQAFTLTRDGQLRAVDLQLKLQAERHPVASDIDYNAQGQVTQELAGNGVLTTLTYGPEDGRLVRRRAQDRFGKVLQHLLYVYDPMGNVTGVEDQALPVRYFANQRIDPISRYTYDSLYQLSEASGWEAGTTSQGPASVGRVDPAAISNYRQTCRYDAGGNLLELTHVGAQARGLRFKTALYSNRGLPWRAGVPPSEAQIAAAYDMQGNLLALDQGRFLQWDLRNQLHSVSPVERAGERNDQEIYLYDAGGQRVRKLRSLQTYARTAINEVRYLPGLELRIDNSVGVLQVITAVTGLNHVNVLHWETPPPSGSNDRFRYLFTDHLGSASLELAEDARIISQETYYLSGETAWSAETEVSYRTTRYSGKERDVTGLYYYGYRYYNPWLQRWMSADPAGTVDGLNLYRMVRNNPATLIDGDGRKPQKPNLPSAPPPPMPPGAASMAPPRPPPPAAGPPPPPSLPAGQAAQAPSVFQPIVLTPGNAPANVASAGWRTEDFVDLGKLATTVNKLFGLQAKSINVVDVTHEALTEKIREIPGNESMHFNKENLAANPPAWTSPKGVVYMGVTAPDYSQNGELNADKIRSTIIHEAMHFLSHGSVGFQQSTDTSIANSNYDEYVADYFAHEVFSVMYPGSNYQTGYFTTNVGGMPLHWGGNMAKYMIDSGHVTKPELQNAFFITGKLKPLSSAQLDTWKTFAKQKARPLKMG